VAKNSKADKRTLRHHGQRSVYCDRTFIYAVLVKPLGHFSGLGRRDSAVNYNDPCCPENYGRHAKTCAVDFERGGICAWRAVYKVIITDCI